MKGKKILDGDKPLVLSVRKRTVWAGLLGMLGVAIVYNYATDPLRDQVQNRAAEVSVAESVPTAASENFHEFDKGIETVNRQILDQSGYVFFLGARDLGGGAVEVVVTSYWESVDNQRQQEIMDAAAHLWNRVGPSAGPLSVQFVNENGEFLMGRERVMN